MQKQKHMRIFNIMMARDLGGIQQSFLDYNEALKREGHKVTNITSLNAKINKQLSSTIKLPHLFAECFFSKIYLRILIAIYKPDVLIAHGGRAITLANALRPKSLKLIGISHNYSYKRLKKCDYIIVPTEELRKHILSIGYDSFKMFLLPNTINITHKYKKREYKNPIIIGSFGRFVKKKGFVYLIESIALLKEQGYQIKLLLGGSGKEEESLKKIVKGLNLIKEVTFTGWVNDKNSFFDKIDIFCLPSISEPFGIILLEAMEHSLPIVASKSGGPSEILRDNQDALMVNIESSSEIANKIADLISDPNMAQNLTYSGYLRLKENYDINVIAKKLSAILQEIIK